MGLKRSVGIGYGFEIPNTTDLNDLDRACFGQPDSPDSVGYIVVGDYDRLLLITRHLPVKENEVVRLGWSLAEPADLAAWEEALHAVAIRLGIPDHPAPAWLAVHNYR